MAPVTNARVLFNSVPTNYPVPGETTILDTTQTIDLEDAPLDGGILIKVLVLSVDPYMRGRMREPHVQSYFPAFDLGQPLTGGGIGLVLRSESPDFKAGEHVHGFLPHQQYLVVPSSALGPYGLTVLARDPRLEWTTYLGAAGMPGQTSYMAWEEFAKPKKNEVVFVTTGAGPVGSLVIQIAKRAPGLNLKVIASAGSDEKVAFMREIGADVVFNYKTTDTREVLKREGPIDIYWDNVGGDVLDAAMEHAATFARFIECGMITGYNGGYQPMKNPSHIIAKSLTLSGFLTHNLRPKYLSAFESEVVPLLASGELKFSEDVSYGLESVGEALVRVQTGANKGKVVVVVAREED